jgi:hypothetical protein
VSTHTQKVRVAAQTGDIFAMPHHQYQKVIKKRGIKTE